MNGTMTAIDASGHIITQTISGAKEGVGFFEALAIQLGHLKSDIGTAAGLPPPFLSLFQLLNFGDIGGRTISQLCRTMYAKGYDFGHFLAMGIPVMMIEVIVRVFYFAKRLHEGKTMQEALPINLPGYAHQPKLQTMLFTAHTVASAINAGKIAITKNPLSVNLPQWLLYAKLSFQQMKWILLDKEMERLDFTQDKLDADWDKVNQVLLSNFTIAETKNFNQEGC